jgi:hypothetical protein
MRLECELIREDGRVYKNTSFGNTAVRKTLEELAIEAGLTAPQDRACTIAIEKMLEIYKSEHGESGMTEAVEVELRVLHELHPNRVQVRRVCRAHKGISCDFAVARGNGEQGQHDLCTYPHVCELSSEEAV